MKITYSAAASIDGFIAREDGDVSWLDDMDIAANETGLEEFFASVDGLVMGRSTYDFVVDYGSWPYGDKPTWVCTHSDPQHLDGANLFVVDEIDTVISEATSRGMQHLWLVGGGRLASAFLKKGLITNLSISEMPIRLGTGVPLFADHLLQDIPSEETNIAQRSGFRQIDMVVKNTAAT